jgi:hypothetical protein
MAPAKTLADMAARWEKHGGAGAGPGAAGNGRHVDEEHDAYDEYDGDDHDVPTCACCRGDARLRGGPFQLGGRGGSHSRRGGAAGGGGAVSRPRGKAGAPPQRVLSASLRAEFQERLEERLSADLGLPKSAARQSLQLCQRLLGICWSDDPAVAAAAAEQQAAGASAGAPGDSQAMPSGSAASGGEKQVQPAGAFSVGELLVGRTRCACCTGRVRRRSRGSWRRPAPVALGTPEATLCVPPSLRGARKHSTQLLLCHVRAAPRAARTQRVSPARQDRRELTLPRSRPLLCPPPHSGPPSQAGGQPRRSVARCSHDAG